MLSKKLSTSLCLLMLIGYTHQGIAMKPSKAAAFTLACIVTHFGFSSLHQLTKQKSEHPITPTTFQKVVTAGTHTTLLILSYTLGITALEIIGKKQGIL